MSSKAKTAKPAPTPAPDQAAGDGAPKKKMSKLILLAPVALALLVAGLWFGGILPPLLGMAAKPERKLEEANKPPPPTFVELPELVANLDAGPRRQAYVKLRAKVELARAEDVAAVTASMPRLQDMFNTYLRQMRPEELRGSLGTWRLHEELLGRANVAVAPVRVTDVLFVEMLVQ